ncbi:MAG TPA: OmpA family protein [Chitinophagaceae bacterium]|nr:OmpA family protein [Chitinophagaceae bacterium]
MKKLLLTAVAITGFMCTQAQFTYDYLRAADNYYKKGDYYSAAQYYEKYLGAAKPNGNRDAYNPYTVQTSSKKSQVPTSSKTQAIYNLAESYRLLNYPEKAEDYYRQALDFDKAQYPLARYWFATTQRALAKYEEAEKAFNEFLAEYTINDKYSESARREIQNLQFIQVQLKKDVSLFNITKAPEGLNSVGASYAPVWLNDNTLYFTSTRPENATAKTKDYTNRIYRAAYSEGVFANINRANVPEAPNMHQGAASVASGSNTMFLTRWTIANGKKTSAIYISKGTGSEWSEPVMMDANINVPGYNSQQPFIMSDGKQLAFASDRPGGRGGFDIWYADLSADGKVINVTNAGEVMNTEYDEQAPYLHETSNTFVFASNGRVGMGGYDLFYCKKTRTGWAVPQNFGYPVNSVKDDIYFASRGPANNILQEVLLSSDRNAACCLELFYVRKTRPMRQVSGSVVACDKNIPLSGATVLIIDTITNKTIATKTTDAQGRYSFTIADYQPLKAVASSTGYVAGSLHFDAPANPEQETMTNEALCLMPVPPPPAETPIVIDNVFYDFNKSSLRTESYPSLDKVMTMLNDHPDMIIEISAHTDNIGSEQYNQRLSEARAKSVVDYLVSKGIDRNRLRAKGYGSSMPIAPNKNPDGSDNPEGRQKNRRTEFKILSN